MENKINITYAVYDTIIDENPSIRFDYLKLAKHYYIKNKSALIVTEVSELINDKLVIIQERIIKAPQIWLPADRFIPEFDSELLCHITYKEACGTLKKYQDVLHFFNGNWQISSDKHVTHWMIVEDPISKIKIPNP